MEETMKQNEVNENNEIDENEVVENEVHEEIIDTVEDEPVVDDALQQEIEQLKDRLLRTQAEYDNFKRRTEKERIAERKYKAESLATALLPALDNFERALQMEVSEENKGFMDGMKMVYTQFTEALQAEEIKTIETENEPFDPNIHQAVMQVEDDAFESNVVVEELQKGYMIKDKVIRPAMVKVNK